MPRRTSAFALSFLAVLSLCPHPAAGGQVSTPLQTKSIPMTFYRLGRGNGRALESLRFPEVQP